MFSSDGTFRDKARVGEYNLSLPVIPRSLFFIKIDQMAHV